VLVISQQLYRILKTPKAIAIWGLLIGLVLYLLGLEWPFVLTVIITVALFMPTPKIMDSWFSRIVLSLLFVFSLLQLAAVIQFFINPAGKFKLIAVITGLLLFILLLLFGKSKPAKVKVIKVKDVCAIISCIFFILPFSPIFAGHHSLERISKLASVQIIDSVAHYSSISDYQITQNLGYKKGGYYPSGFQISTSFMQHSILGDNEKLSWRTHVYEYFGQYIFFGLLLELILVYLGYTVLFSIKGKPLGPAACLALALSIGLGVTISDLLLFMNEGFLNFYYINTAIFAGLIYIFDSGEGFRHFVSAKLSDKWPIVAFLLLTVGASLSWPLLILPILLCAGLWLVPSTYIDTKKLCKAIFRLTSLPIAILLLFHLSAIYFQLRYSLPGQYSIVANGGVHSFNLPLLIIGTLVVTGTLFWSKTPPDFRKALTTVTVPFILLVTGLMLLQFFGVGEARYYLIKTAEVLEMVLIVVSGAILVYGLEQSDIQIPISLLFAPIVITFFVIATIGMLPKPLDEVRGLFRGYTNEGSPQYMDSDVHIMAELGAQGRIVRFNVSAIHYDPTSEHFFANPETVIWANDMAKLTDDRGAGSCFDNQLRLLAYAAQSEAQQTSLVNTLKNCIDSAHQRGLQYYIATDAASAPKLQAALGDSVKLVY